MAVGTSSHVGLTRCASGVGSARTLDVTGNSRTRRPAQCSKISRQSCVSRLLQQGYCWSVVPQCPLQHSHDQRQSLQASAFNHHIQLKLGPLAPKEQQHSPSKLMLRVRSPGSPSLRQVVRLQGIACWTRWLWRLCATACFRPRQVFCQQVPRSHTPGVSRIEGAPKRRLLVCASPV